MLNLESPSPRNTKSLTLPKRANKAMTEQDMIIILHSSQSADQTDIATLFCAWIYNSSMIIITQLVQYLLEIATFDGIEEFFLQVTQPWPVHVCVCGCVCGCVGRCGCVDVCVGGWVVTVIEHWVYSTWWTACLIIMNWWLLPWFWITSWPGQSKKNR